MIINYALKTMEQMKLQYSRLSKKERKRYAALEALRLGQGGVEYISNILGIRKNTIKEAIKEMAQESETAPMPRTGARKISGGRKKNA